jgi:DnaJ-class molecular chaperone
VQKRGSGDLHVRFHVAVPTKLDAGQRKAVEALAEALDGRPVELPEERDWGGLGALFGRKKQKRR